MKNQLFLRHCLAISLFTASLTFTSCVEKGKEKPEPPKEEMPEEETPGANKEPDGIISLDEAKILCRNYEARRTELIRGYEKEQNSDEDFIPTQFVDFDFKTMEKYIRYVKRQAKKAKVKPDSLRIYFGNYGPDGRDPNRNTIFVLPTGNINGERGGFFINADGKAELVRNYWPKDDGNYQNQSSQSKASMMPSFAPFQTDKSLTLNSGHGGPPPTGDF